MEQDTKTTKNQNYRQKCLAMVFQQKQV